MSAWGWSAQPLHYLCCILTASTITTRAGGVKVTQELYIIYNSVFMLWFTVCKNTTNTSRKCSDDPWKTPGSASAHDWLEILMLPKSRWDVWLCLHTRSHVRSETPRSQNTAENVRTSCCLYKLGWKTSPRLEEEHPVVNPDLVLNSGLWLGGLLTWRWRWNVIWHTL